MMHPRHLHGMPMRIVARDGYDLGAAAFTCDTLGAQPGRALGRRNRLRRARCVGLPLPHPAARGGSRRDVRHGHGAGRPGSLDRTCGQPVERVAGRGGCRRGRIHGPHLPDHVSISARRRDWPSPPGPGSVDRSHPAGDGPRPGVGGCRGRGAGAGSRAPCRPAHRERHRWALASRPRSTARRGWTSGAQDASWRPRSSWPGPPGRRERVCSGLGGRTRSRHRRSRRSGAGRPGGCRHAWPQPGRTGRSRQRVRPRDPTRSLPGPRRPGLTSGLWPAAGGSRAASERAGFEGPVGPGQMARPGRAGPPPNESVWQGRSPGPRRTVPSPPPPTGSATEESGDLCTDGCGSLASCSR